MIHYDRTTVDAFALIHRLRMRRDFGVFTEDLDDYDLMPESNPKTLEEYAEASREMFRIFGNDTRATRMIDGIRSLKTTENEIWRTLKRMNRTTHAKSHSEMSRRIIDILEVDRNIQERIPTCNSSSLISEIMEHIKSVQVISGLIGQDIASLEQSDSEFAQYMDELQRADNTYISYSTLMEKEIDMRLYIKEDFPLQKSHLEHKKLKLEEAKNSLESQVMRLQQIQVAYPDIQVMMDAIRDSECTLVQLQSELESRKSELANLAKVETTIIDELHTLRERKRENERILSMTEEQYEDERNRRLETEHEQYRNLENEICHLEESLNGANAELNNLREVLLASHGQDVLATMQRECHILRAKQILF